MQKVANSMADFRAFTIESPSQANMIFVNPNLKAGIMGLGPLEIVVIAFPANAFSGEIIPALSDLIETNTVTIIDGLFISKEADGAVSFTEIEELSADNSANQLAELFNRLEGLISTDDIDEIADGLELNSSAAVLVFEHTWIKPIRDAVVNSGGVMLESIRIPGHVADEVLAASLAAVEQN